MARNLLSQSNRPVKIIDAISSTPVCLKRARRPLSNSLLFSTNKNNLYINSGLPQINIGETYSKTDLSLNSNSLSLLTNPSSGTNQYTLTLAFKYSNDDTYYQRQSISLVKFDTNTWELSIRGVIIQIIITNSTTATIRVYYNKYKNFTILSAYYCNDILKEQNTLTRIPSYTKQVNVYKSRVQTYSNTSNANCYGYGWQSICVAKNLILICSRQYGVRYSEDNGVTWKNTNISSGYASGICYYDGKFAVGYQDVDLANHKNTPKLKGIFYFNDGKTWTHTGISAMPLYILHANGYWVAASSEGVYYKPDTVVMTAWYTSTLPNTISNVSSLAYGNGIFLLTTYNSGSGIYWSKTGSSWTKCTTPSNHYGGNPVYIKGTWLVGSTGSTEDLLTSKDGKTWSIIYPNIYAFVDHEISYVNGTIYAPGLKNGTMLICNKPGENLSQQSFTAMSEEDFNLMGKPFRGSLIYLINNLLFNIMGFDSSVSPYWYGFSFCNIFKSPLTWTRYTRNPHGCAAEYINGNIIIHSDFGNYSNELTGVISNTIDTNFINGTIDFTIPSLQNITQEDIQ